MQATLKATPIFYKHAAAKDARVVVHRGGARSSKSYSIAQYLNTIFLQYAHSHRIKILILRKTQPSIKTSVLETYKSVLESFGKDIVNSIKEEKKDMNFIYEKGIVHFGGLDDPEKIKCFTPDTEVLTDSGWKNIKNVTIHDKVLSYNYKSGRSTYSKVLKTFKYDYTGLLYSPKKGNAASFRITDNHKVLVQNAAKQTFFRIAKEMDSLNYVGIQHSILTSYFDSFNSSENIVLESIQQGIPVNYSFSTKQIFTILGYCLSSNSIFVNKKSIFINIQDHIMEYSELIAALIHCGFKHNVDAEKKCIHIESDVLGNIVFNSIGVFQTEKRIPRYFLEYEDSDRILKAFFKHTKVKGNYSYTTVYSKQLVDALMEIAVKNGSVLSYKEIKKDGYTAFELKYAETQPVERSTLLKSFDKKSYKGKVYCLEVERFHNMLIRHNGKCCFSGNSSEWNFIWMEEATEFTYEDYRQLRLRLSSPEVPGLKNQLILSFNPVDESHWVKTKVLDLDKSVVEIHSTYKDNPFIEKNYLIDMEERIQLDPNFARIYAFGEWGNLDTVIYNNWDLVDDLPTPIDIPGLKIIFGLDFGFNAPSAMVQCNIHPNKKDVWLKEVLYNTNMTVDDIIDRLPYILNENYKSLIICDSAEPEKIKRLKQAGFYVKPAEKGQNSVKVGIEFIKTLREHITKDSSNLIKEKRGYSWMKDRKTEIVLDTPIGMNDHLMDAERYALYTYLKKGGVNFRWL